MLGSVAEDTRYEYKSRIYLINPWETGIPSQNHSELGKPQKKNFFFDMSTKRGVGGKGLSTKEKETFF